MQKTIDTVIRIAMIGLMIVWCFQIVRPFITMMIWGIIIAIAVYPGFQRISAMTGGKQGYVAVLITVVMLFILAGPIVLLGSIVVDNAQVVARELNAGTVHIPPPPEKISGWPLIGKPVAQFWTLASANLENALQLLAPQLHVFAGWLLNAVASTGLEILQFIVSIIISGILLANARGGNKAALDLARRIAGERGSELTHLAEAIIRGVVRGVLGVALIQSILAGLGFVVADVPGAGLLAVLCLFLAVIQVGPVLVMIPVVIYVYSIHDGFFASSYLVWSIFVTLIDNVLRPMLMGKGIDLPLLVIFIGAIGGMLLSGLIGLFVGAVVLALGYTLFQAWMDVERVGVETVQYK